MIETVKTYRRDVPGQSPIQIKVVYDHNPNSATYLGYWDADGDPREMNLTPHDLSALLSMLHAADFAKEQETE
ncbi:MULTISPECIES: hypothetical protein [Streptomyces]|uniref:hypothetical protein n=1 Tax=Streptomyces TaxID=1883 RepID=UPI001E505EF7|nr:MULTISPECIES: hypothetical protein [Streptomyces]UFQ16389.1 hypothetical protein J2N69_16040 [Streptomyces huasconensis]WCL85992.1 hypothetical protein PPN52_16050 [Streptomyces sp. JCM 35825]